MCEILERNSTIAEFCCRYTHLLSVKTSNLRKWYVFIRHFLCKDKKIGEVFPTVVFKVPFYRKEFHQVFFNLQILFKVQFYNSSIIT